MFKNILIPTDGSAFSKKAVKQALRFAKKQNAKVTSVHVFCSNPFGAFGDSCEVAIKQTRELGIAQAKKFLDYVQTQAKSVSVKLDRVVMDSDRAWVGIIATARRKRCDLIVMGAHGRGAVSSLLLGSETSAVLAHSKIPV